MTHDDAAGEREKELVEAAWHKLEAYRFSDGTPKDVSLALGVLYGAYRVGREEQEAHGKHEAFPDLDAVWRDQAERATEKPYPSRDVLAHFLRLALGHPTPREAAPPADVAALVEEFAELVEASAVQAARYKKHGVSTWGDAMNAASELSSWVQEHGQEVATLLATQAAAIKRLVQGRERVTQCAEALIEAISADPSGRRSPVVRDCINWLRAALARSRT